MKKEIVKLRRIAPFTEYEKSFNSYNPKLHKKGWITWTYRHNWEYANNADVGYISVHPEGNKYGMNLDPTRFEVID